MMALSEKAFLRLGERSQYILRLGLSASLDLLENTVETSQERFSTTNKGLSNIGPNGYNRILIDQSICQQTGSP